AETSTFGRVVIVLSNDGRSLFPAGHAGFDSEQVQRIEHQCAHRWKFDNIAEICRAGASLGPNSFLLQPPQLDKSGPIPSSQQFEPNRFWENGSVVIVPLLSTRGIYVGALALDDPRDVTRVTAEEMSKIELLAGDLAVTIDNTALHRQLARSEKLAA